MIPRPVLRGHMRQRRRALRPGERAACAVQVARRLTGHPAFRSSVRVALYLPNDGEVDLRPLLQRAHAMGKTCHLPVLCPLGTRHMWFAPYRPGDPLKLNRFGIPEPSRPGTPLVRARSLDLILAPLVAFDMQGNRLGMGGGFYDHTLAYLRSRRHWRKPTLIGIAYDFQKVEHLEHKPWDIPLGGIATEFRFYDTRPGSPDRERGTTGN